GTTVEAPIAMTVPLEADSRDAGRPDRALGHAAGGDVDLAHAPGHRSVEDEDALAGGLRVEEAIGLVGLRKPEAVGEETLQRDATLHDEPRAFLLDQRAEGPRGVERQLAPEEVGAHVEGHLVPFPDEADPAPGPGRARRRQTGVRLSRAVERRVHPL